MRSPTFMRGLALKLFAVALAVVLRFMVAGDPTVERGLRVPLEFENLPGSVEIMGDPPETVEVRVRGSSGVLRRLEAGDVAAIIGAPLIRVFGGHVSPEIEDREPLFEPLARCNKEVAAYGAEKGVIVALQNHDSSNMAATAEDVLRILEETALPNFSLILDTGQWQGSPGAGSRGESDPDVDIYSYIEQTASHAVYVRTKFYRNDSGKEEWLDYERIMAILRGVDYNGSLSIVYEGEAEGDDRVEAVRKAAAELRGLL